MELTHHPKFELEDWGCCTSRIGKPAVPLNSPKEHICRRGSNSKRTPSLVDPKNRCQRNVVVHGWICRMRRFFDSPPADYELWLEKVSELENLAPVSGELCRWPNAFVVVVVAVVWLLCLGAEPVPADFSLRPHCCIWSLFQRAFFAPPRSKQDVCGFGCLRRLCSSLLFTTRKQSILNKLSKIKE